MKHLFILNPKCFKSHRGMDQVVSEIKDFFRISGSGDFMIYISQFPRDAVSVIRAFASTVSRDTVIRVYAVGGDGILFDCLNGIMGFDNIELAAVPYGNTNNFVRGFGKQNMPLFRDISLQFTAPTIPLDILYSGSTYALNFCTVGVESKAIIKTQELRERLSESNSLIRWLGGRLYEQLYYVGAIPVCFDRRLLHQSYEVIIDGEDFSGQYRGIHISNGAWYGGNKSPVKAALPDDGVMDILLGYPAGSLKSLVQLPFFIKGYYNKFPPYLRLKRAKKISIRSEEPLLINFDDIVSYSTNFTVELLPNAVKFVDVSRQGYRGALKHG